MLPRVIRSDEECERQTSELMRLDEQKDSSPEEKDGIADCAYWGKRVAALPDSEGEPAADAAAFDGGAWADAEGSVEDVWVEGNYVGGVSREARYQQNAS
jgi:hypothetical protein